MNDRTKRSSPTAGLSSEAARVKGRDVHELEASRVQA